MSKPVHVDRADCQIRPTTRRKLLAGGAATCLSVAFGRAWGEDAASHHERSLIEAVDLIELHGRYTDAAGRPVNDTRDIHVRANDWFSVDFTRPAPAEPQAMPPAVP